MRTSGVPYCLRLCDTDAISRAMDATSGSDVSDSEPNFNFDGDDMEGLMLAACDALDQLPQCPSFVTCDDDTLLEVELIRQGLRCDGNSDSDDGTMRFFSLAEIPCVLEAWGILGRN